MPLKGIFKREDSILHLVRLHRRLDDKISKYCLSNNITRVEAENYALAKIFDPALIKKFDKFKIAPRYTFPNRNK